MQTLQNKLGALALCSLLFVGTLPVVGCAPQATLAALTSTLGNAASSIAALEGNQALAAQLRIDTAAATAAIQNWKSGTPAQNVVQALNIVIDDLNLVCPPGGPCGPYAPLILLALGTAESIIAILNPGAAAKGVRGDARTVSLVNPPKNSKQFTQQWNDICKQNSALAHVTI